jgi:hypothetical protein
MTTWTYQPNETDGIDTYLDSVAPTTAKYNDNYLWGGYYSTPQITTTLLKPDFTKGTNPPPSGATFSSCVLTLYHIYNYATVNSTLYIYRCLKNWVETQATYNIYSTGNNWGTAGARNSTTDYYATELGSIAQSSTETSGEKNITINAAEFTKMFNGTYNNYGFVIFLPTTSYTLHGYASSSHATSTYRPKITAEWTTTGIPGVKTVNGVPMANIKTINGIPVADVKSLQGLTFAGEWLRKLDWIRKGELWISRNNGLVTI